MIILPRTEEDALQAILKKYDGNSKNYVKGTIWDTFPEYMSNSMKKILDSIERHGYILSAQVFLGGEWFCTLAPSAITYFDDKKQYEKYLKQSSEASVRQHINIQNIHGSIITLGSVNNSNLTVGDIYIELERQIEEKGGEDKEELKKLLVEAKQIGEEIEINKKVPSDKKGFLSRLRKHADKYGWFYNGVMNLIGVAVLCHL